MGYTKQQRLENEAKKKAPLESANIETTEDATVTETVTTKPRRIKLADDTVVRVKSNVFGRLFYQNSRTNSEYMWDSYGEIQDLYISDLREMKGVQKKFFSENWIMIEGLADYEDDSADVTVEDVYTFLQVQQYYKDILCPDNLDKVLAMSIEQLQESIPKMSNGTKLSLIILANTQIADGVIDSIKKIKALEELFGCELTRPE